jgi:outer membrane lipoprotein SlyB
MLAAALLGAAALLSACGTREPIAEGTVVSVQEVVHHEAPMVPEVAWKVDVRLDDGSEVTLGHKGDKRYAPGERVRLLIDEEGALLL